MNVTIILFFRVEDLVYKAVDAAADKSVQQRRAKERKEASENILHAQQVQKRDYDRRNNRSKHLPVGTLVLKENKRRTERKGDRMVNPWTGPYVIHDYSDSGHPILRDLKKKQPMKRATPRGHLKEYKQRDTVDNPDAPEYASSNPDSPEALPSSSAFEQYLLGEFMNSDESLPSMSPLKRPADLAKEDQPLPKRRRLAASVSLAPDERVWTPPTEEWRKKASKTLGISITGPNLKYASSPKKFHVHDSPKDTIDTKGCGNCFYRSICSVVSGDIQFNSIIYRDVKARLFNFMEKNSSAIDNLAAKTDYVNTSGTRLPDRWATEVEIVAMASLLNTTIGVYSVYASTWSWAMHKPSSQMSNGPINDEVIYLYNKNRNHYEPVISIKSTKK